MRKIMAVSLFVCIAFSSFVSAFASEYDQGFGYTYFSVESYVSTQTYQAGEPITFTVAMKDGNPPFEYSWEIGERFNTSSYSLLEEYIMDDNFITNLPHGTTNNRKLQITYTPPVAGDDLTAICYITDRDGKVAEAHMTVFSPLAWAAAYAQFIFDAQFIYSTENLSVFYDNTINEIDDLYTGPYIESRRPLSFSLYDMSGDGIPELLMDRGGDFAMGCVDVYTYQDHAMQLAGFMEYHEYFNPTVSTTPGMPGIYYSTGNMGSFDTCFDYLSGSELDGIILFNECIDIYDEDGEPIAEASEPIVTWETSDQKIINDWNRENHKSLLFYPLSNIQAMGWWNGGFLEAKFLGDGRDQTVIELVSKVQNLVDNAKNISSIIGYGYYSSLPSNWLETILWTDFFQGHISSLDMAYNRQRFLFSEAVQMCTSPGKKAKFVKMNEMPDGLVLMGNELKLEEAAYARTVKNLCDPSILKRYELDSPYFEKLISDTVSGKRHPLDTYQDLAQLGMSYDDIDDIMSSIDIIDTIQVAGKMAKTYSNVKKTWNSVAEIVNKWSLLDSLDKEQMLQIADSYENGNEDMKAIAKTLRTFAKSGKVGQITLITSDKVLKLGLDYLFDFLSATLLSEAAKVTGSVVTATYALTYAAIDFLTGVGDLTASYTNLVFAGETVDHFWSNVNSFRGYLRISPSENNLLRAAYAYVNYYNAAAELNEKYYELVQTGDSAILKDFVNNDAMRQESARAKEQAKELRSLAQEMVQLLSVLFK